MRASFACWLLVALGGSALADFLLDGSARAAEPASRAAWWLAQDDVKPIADLSNTAQPGAPPKFVDRVGTFSVRAEGARALIITGSFPEATIWRFDLTTFDSQFDMRKLYVAKSANCAFPDPDSMWTKKLTAFLGDAEKGRTSTGPWGIYGGRWLVPTARVSLDGRHVYTSWFDDPSLEDFDAGRIYASFALDIPAAGEHTIRVSFDDFAHNTRWRGPRWKGDIKPEITYSKNDLRPHHIGSIAIGVDERVRALEKVSLRPELRGKHPRLDYGTSATGAAKSGSLSVQEIEPMLLRVDPDRAKPWEYCIDEESMASDNDMDAGKKGAAAAREYDLHVPQLSPEARREWDRVFRGRFQQLYTFFVFQRNFHPTGYAQNHSSATVIGLLSAGMVWDGPEAEKWLRWGIMTCRKRIELYGKDGGVEWMNEARDYGLSYFVAPLQLIKHGTGLDLTKNEPFFQNEWRYALHQSWLFPTGQDRRPPMLTLGREFRGKENPNVPIPPSATPENTPTNWHFEDVDQVYMRSDWGENAYRARLWAGSVFGKQGAKAAKRYNWAHCAVNQGSFVLSQGKQEIILEAGWTRDYRKTAASNNCILINDTDQWGGGQVWHPRLEASQIAPIVFFADGALLSVARTDLKNAYPPAANVEAVSRCLLHIKPDLFLVFDRVATRGPGKAEWRYHAAYVEPLTSAARFTAYGYDARPPLGDRSPSYEAAFKKRADVHCDVAFLTPGTSATVGMTDTYYRWSTFSQPQRHLKVVRQSAAPMTLLTAFGPKIDAQSKDNVHLGNRGDIAWSVLVGAGGAKDGLQADGHVAVSVENTRTGRVELMRFGGSNLSWKGIKVDSQRADVFAAIERGKVVP